MDHEGGGWTFVGNQRSATHFCQSGSVGSLTSPEQTSSWRLSDAQINSVMAASGNSQGLFWVQHDDSDPLYFRYGVGGETSTFASMGCSSSSIHTCSKSVDGPWLVGHSYSNHCGLDTYGQQGVNQCGRYFMSCYGSAIYLDGSSSGRDTTIWVRSGIA